MNIVRENNSNRDERFSTSNRSIRIVSYAAYIFLLKCKITHILILHRYIWTTKGHSILAVSSTTKTINEEHSQWDSFWPMILTKLSRYSDGDFQAFNISNTVWFQRSNYSHFPKHIINQINWIILINILISNWNNLQ